MSFTNPQVSSDTIVTETICLRDPQTGSMRKPLRKAKKGELIVCHSLPVVVHENVGTSVRVQLTQEQPSAGAKDQGRRVWEGFFEFQIINRTIRIEIN